MARKRRGERRIAFCTTCKGRLQHLKQTLPRNLADNAGYENAVFVVLDYGGQEDLLQWLVTEHGDDMRSGRLAVYRHPTDKPFHMAHAKNIAHRCGLREGADVLVNLDADNLTGEGFADYVAGQFAAADHVFLRSVWPFGRDPSSTSSFNVIRGCSGRIAVTRAAFMQAGGYDERYGTWGPDDKDFNARLTQLGYTAVEIDGRYLNSLPHRDKMRFKEYPHARATGYRDFTIDADSTIANAGQFGCGVVFKGLSCEAVRLMPPATRIFGVGMHKTATGSLNAALRVLGIDSAHWESGDWARSIWEEMRLEGRSRTLERHYALSDLPITLLYKELDKGYPGSKFILTVRDDDKWLDSVRRHWTYEHNPFRWEWDVYPFSNRIHKELYGRVEFNAATFLARYKRHNAEVRAYFAGRPGDLLVLNVDKGAGWAELCGFLGVQTPSAPYPKVTSAV